MIPLLISFIAGVLTVLAPCILPLLPVIVGGTLSEGGGALNKKKAFTIILSLGVSVVLFTFLLKASTLFIDIPEVVWSWISGGIVIFLGLIFLFPSLWENRLLAKLSIKSNILLGKGEQKKTFWGDVVVGAALGPVFSTCSPTYFIVLATVLPVSPILGTVYLLTYTVGLCLALLIIALVGQKIMDKLGIVADPRGWFKRILGLIFLLVGLAIIGGLDKKTQILLLDAGFFDVTKIEQKLLELQDPEPMPESEPMVEEEREIYLSLSQKQLRYRKVPELSSINAYINTEGEVVTLESLKGKVVLLDIWTYSCINCQRTIPYLNKWYEKYKDQGFVIVGLHTPEFAFEQVQTNVERAVDRFEIEYPVVLDNDYSTWNTLGNQYWPRKYLIDIDGFIIYDHAGEGAYEETEIAIQKALQERVFRMGMEDKMINGIAQPENIVKVDFTKVRSPETYFGSLRNSLLANGTSGVSGEQTFTLPQNILINKLYLVGPWNITPEYAENTGEATIIFSYEAKNVYITAGSGAGVFLEIYQDDVFVKKVLVKNADLYQLIGDAGYGKHLLKIKIPAKGLKAFTFTFG